MTGVLKGKYYCPSRKLPYKTPPDRPNYPTKEILYDILKTKKGSLKKFDIVLDKKEPEHKWLYTLAYNLDPYNQIFSKEYRPHIRKPRADENIMAPKCFEELLKFLPEHNTKKKIKKGSRLLKR